MSIEFDLPANVLQGIVDETSATLRKVDSMTLDSLSESTHSIPAQETTVTVALQEVAVSSAGGQYNETSSFIPKETVVAFRTTTVTSMRARSGSISLQDSADISSDVEVIKEDFHLKLRASAPAVDKAEENVESNADSTPISTTIVEIQIGPQHFELCKLLGTGAFGKVVLVQNRLNRRFYAMKVISKHLIKKKNNLQYMKSERDILTKVRHPFLVSLQFAFQSETKLFLVMDFLSGGELFLHLRRRGLIMEREVQFYLGEMILAMEFLHQRGIIHRDLKPENVLLRADAHICITDFGLAKEIGNDMNVRTLCGTSEYMAPEMLTRSGYGKAVDWWALGALCYEMLVGKPPFTSKTNNQKELDKKIIFEKLSTPSYLTGAAVSLLRGMLEKDPTKRLGCAKSTMFSLGGITMLKQHEFFNGLDWIALGNVQLVPPINLNNSNQNKSEDLDTKFFSEEFTTQALSPSLLEDTYSTHTPSPMNRSRVISGRNSPSPPLAEDDPFHNFEYTDTTFQCTVNQLEEYQQMMVSKQQKLLKKKSLRLKKEAKQAEEEVERKLRQEHEEQLRIVRFEQERQRKEQEAIVKQQKEEFARQQKVKQQKEKERLAHNTSVQQYQDELTALQKRIKNARKKLREITELREKLSSQQAEVNKDQKQKLAKEKEVEVELQALLVTELEMIEVCPGEIIPPPEDDSAAVVSEGVNAAPVLEVPSSVGAAIAVPHKKAEVNSSSSSSRAQATKSLSAWSAAVVTNSSGKQSANESSSNGKEDGKEGSSPSTAITAPTSSKSAAATPKEGEWATVATNSKKKGKPRG